MAPKKTPVVVTSVNVDRELDRLSYDMPITPNTSIGQLKAALKVRFAIADDVEIKLRHHGHRLSNDDKVGSKSPLCLQEIAVVKSINDSMTILELSNWTSPELLTYALANAVVVNKSASKVAIMDAIMTHKHGPDGDLAENDMLRKLVETQKAEIVHLRELIMAMKEKEKEKEKESDRLETASTSWWTNEQEDAKTQAQIKTDKQQAIKQSIKQN